METVFKFNLGDDVKMEYSDEKGKVCGRAEYTDETPSYFVRYMDAEGKATSGWRAGEALSLLR